MKKAKLMLMAIIVLGIASGALAFKAKQFGTNVIVYSKCSGIIDKDCDSGTLTFFNFTQAIIGGAATITAAGTTDSDKACTSDADCQIPTLTLYAHL